ncbi:MAG: magnesium transporter CorA family protein, partial [Anaerolineae bacterium]|nr:magnesium transporter CorA family protein [Anaerolineae bacterium]
MTHIDAGPMSVRVYDEHGCQKLDQPDWAALLADTSHIVWVDMDGPSAEHLQIMHEVFKFHPLAIEDTHNKRQRAKMEEYDGHLFVILNTMGLHNDELIVRELDVFIGPNFLVTVHKGDMRAVHQAEERAAAPHTRLPISSGFLLYTLMDVVIDSYFPLLERFSDRLEMLEDAIINETRSVVVPDLVHMKRMARRMWQVVWPNQSLANHLINFDEPYMNQGALEYYFRDIYDHTIRIVDVLNTYRDTLTSVTDIYMSATSNRLNRVVNR